MRTATAHRRGEIKFKAIERYTLHVNPVKAPPHAPAMTRNSYGSRHTLAVYYRTARLLLLQTESETSVTSAQSHALTSRSAPLLDAGSAPPGDDVVVDTSPFLPPASLESGVVPRHTGHVGTGAAACSPRASARSLAFAVVVARHCAAHAAHTLCSWQACISTDFPSNGSRQTGLVALGSDRKRPEATGSRCANGTRDNAGRRGRGSGILHGEWERGEREGRKPVLVMAQALTTRIERQ